jgi:alpha-L-fucosidase
MRLRAVLLLPLTIALVLLGAPVSGALASPVAYPVTGSDCASISVSTTVPAPGESITVTGVNFNPGGHVRLVLDTGDVLARVTADASGSFTTKVKMPKGVFGFHKLYHRGGKTGQPSSGCPADPGLNIGSGANVPGGTPGHHGGTSFTGLDIGLLLAAAALLIAVGVALNRRSQKSRKSRRKRVVAA